jgi:hypothetical protein
MAGSGSMAALSLSSSMGSEARLRRSASVASTEGPSRAHGGGGGPGGDVHVNGAHVPPRLEADAMASGKAVHGWVLRSVDVSSYLASAIAQALPPPAAGSPLSPEAHAFESVRSMTRSDLDAALRAAKVEGLADDVWASIQRLNAGRTQVATAMEKLEKRDVPPSAAKPAAEGA